MIVSQDYNCTEVVMDITEALAVIKGLTDAIESARRIRSSSFMIAATSQTFKHGKQSPGVITWRVREPR